MPETRGLPEPEPTRVERTATIVNEVVAGQGVVRRTLLYAVVGVAIVVLLLIDGVVGLLAGGLGIIGLLFLMASDPGLA